MYFLQSIGNIKIFYVVELAFLQITVVMEFVIKVKIIILYV